MGRLGATGSRPGWVPGSRGPWRVRMVPARAAGANPKDRRALEHESGIFHSDSDPRAPQTSPRVRVMSLPSFSPSVNTGNVPF